MNRHTPLLLVVLALVCAPLVACGADASNATAEPVTTAAQSDPAARLDRPVDAVPVVVARAVRGAVTSSIIASGNLEAVDLVEVLAKVPGQIDTLHVEEGSRVEAGAVLLELDPDEYRLAAEQAEAQLDKRRADVRRYERMLAEGVLSQVEYDQAAFDVRQAELSHEQALINLEGATVRAPIAGVISSREVHLGARVTANQPLFTIVNPDRLWVHVHVPEADLPGLAAGQAAVVTSDVLSPGTFQATVERVAPVVDPQSGTAKVTVRMASPESLRPGMFVNVSITTGHRDDALLIPRRAIVYAGDSTAVFRVEGSDGDFSVAQVPVRLGAGGADQVEVLDGLAAGDRVVVLGQDALRTGVAVKIVTGESVGLAAGR